MTEFSDKIIVDWLQFTLLRDDGLETVLKILKQKKDDFESLDKGGLGYKRQIINNNVRLYFEGLPGMGVCCSVSGKGCRYLEAQGQNLWRLLFRLARSAKINITRIDLALDTGVKLINKVRQSVDKKKYISKSRNISYICKSLENETRTETIYFGSRSSELMIRLYDKAVEQKLEDTVWERWEIVLKKKKIKEVMPLLERDVSQTFRDILYTYFRPLQSVDSNKSRSKICKWYLDFLGSVQKISLYSEPREKTIEDKWLWLEKQVAPTMALLSEAFENTDFLGRLAESNYYRIKEKDLQLARKFKGE